MVSVFHVKFMLPVVLLFVLLSPGFLLHLPVPDEDGNIVAPLSGNTSLSATLFHAVVYAVVLSTLMYFLGYKLSN